MTPREWPAEVLERMAMGIHESQRRRYPLTVSLGWHDLDQEDQAVTRRFAADLLSALSPAAQAVARGEAVAVPREPTQEMFASAAAVDDHAYVHGSQHGASDEAIYLAMLAASPWAQEPPR